MVVFFAALDVDSDDECYYDDITADKCECGIAEAVKDVAMYTSSMQYKDGHS